MAFQAPTNVRRASLRIHDPAESTQLPEVHSPTAESSSTKQDVDEWVVFSPSSYADSATVTGTNPLSRVSELGSIISTSSPLITRHDGIPGAFDDVEEDELEDDESLEGTETDSLQAFRDLRHEGPVMLPTHDGLGTFSSSSDVLSGLRSLEQSLRVVGHIDDHSEKNARINKWRMEQSQALLDEIEKQTRRRRLSLISTRSGQLPRDAVLEEEEETASMSVCDIGDESSGEVGEQVQTEDSESESLWVRLTRSFIRDVIGIDGSVLEVIFGEALPAEAYEEQEDKGKRTAEQKFIDRIARELGILIDHYTVHSEGAFSTAPQHKEDGDKTPQPRSRPSDSVLLDSPRKRARSDSFASLGSKSSAVPQFQFSPTLNHQDEASHAALWGIEEEPEETLAQAQARKEYWEQELSMRLVFSYLKSRFSGRSGQPPSSSSNISSHHPLINKNHRPAHYSSSRRPSSTSVARTFTSSNNPSLFAAGPGLGIRGGSSCASQSTKAKDIRPKSSRASSLGKGYYWDVATSVGSGNTNSCVGTGVWAAI